MNKKIIIIMSILILFFVIFSLCFDKPENNNHPNISSGVVFMIRGNDDLKTNVSVTITVKDTNGINVFSDIVYIYRLAFINVSVSLPNGVFSFNLSIDSYRCISGNLKIENSRLYREFRVGNEFLIELKAG